MEWVYGPIVAGVKLGMRAMGWAITVDGAERIPASGPGILTGNHISYLDPILMGYAADLRDRRVRFLATSELWEIPVFRRMLTQMRHIPVHRDADRGRSLAAAASRLADGDVVGLFPEGSIAASGLLATFKPGAARLALRTGVPLLPMAFWGGQRLLTRDRPRNLQRGVALSVRIGAPLEYSSDEPAEAVTARLHDRTRRLLDEAIAAYPQQPAGSHDRWWLPHTLGGTEPTDAAAADIRREEGAGRNQESAEHRQEHLERPADPRPPHDDGA